MRRRKDALLAGQPVRCVKLMVIPSSVSSTLFTRCAVTFYRGKWLGTEVRRHVTVAAGIPSRCVRLCQDCQGRDEPQGFNSTVLGRVPKYLSDPFAGTPFLTSYPPTTSQIVFLCSVPAPIPISSSLFAVTARWDRGCRNEIDQDGSTYRDVRLARTYRSAKPQFYPTTQQPHHGHHAIFHHSDFHTLY